MPKYLVKVSYTLDGLKGLIAKGGSARVEAATHAIESQGGSVESFYFALGEHDVYVVTDAPDNVAISAVVLAINAAGGAVCQTVVLLTPEEVDQAAQKTVDYSPPGS